MSRVAKDTAFHGWVANSTAKVRAFFGWAIGVTGPTPATAVGPLGAVVLAGELYASISELGSLVAATEQGRLSAVITEGP